jgi:hypothetical protein
MHVSLNLSLPPLHAPSGYNFIWDYLLESGRGSTPEGVDARAASFLAFCLQYSSKSKAQMMQDIYVLFRLPKTNGFFVEFGGTDGITINNTYLLENTMSWSGVVAEPFPCGMTHFVPTESAKWRHGAYGLRRAKSSTLSPAPKRPNWPL